MQEKSNPWMGATFLLIGLIAGFFIGRMNPAESTFKRALSPNNGVEEENIPPRMVDLSPAIDYSGVEMKQLSEGHFTLGDPDAKVTIQEFSDLQCPFCKKFFNESFQKLIDEYVKTGKVYYVFYNYPLTIHPEAPKAAEAAHCAGEQNKYWEMHDLLFVNQDFWSFQPNYLETINQLAEGLDLNMGSFEECVSSNKYAKIISDDTTLGTEKGVSGTPTLFVNETKIVGAQPYQIFADAIEAALK